MKKRIILILILGISICGYVNGQEVKVLNFGTFHMAGTTDAHKVKFDENSKKSKSATYEIAKMLAKFKPTIICVEIVPGKNEELNNDYSNFLKNENYKAKFGGEIALIAYEVGKIAGVEKIYGIDEKKTAPYNYNIVYELENQVDSLTAKNYINEVMKEFAKLKKLSTLEKLQFLNSKETLEKLMNINADILTYVGTKGNYEGADEASKFYRRNLRMYSNLNQIPAMKHDRILIIMGATHTAFLNQFLQRSPKYELENTANYLK